MRKLYSRLIIIILAVLLLFPIADMLPHAHASGGTQANAATSFKGTAFTSLIHGDSYITGLGKLSKITLYLATTNDPDEFPRKSDGSVDVSNVAATRKDGQPLFVKFGKSIINRENYSIPQASYVNLDTSKLDSLIDLKNGQKRAPAYNTKIGNTQATSMGMPEWYVSGNNNHTAVVDWVKDAANVAKSGTQKFDNLSKVIFKVAESSDPAKAVGLSAVNNVLYRTKTKATFNYKDASGKNIDLNVNAALPWGATGTSQDNNRGLATWLIIYEPVIHYAQDPHKLFYGSKGGNHFLMTATDAILTNMHSGTSGYVSVEKFARNTPTITAHYNYCRICDKTWYGYPGWSKANIPLAKNCPTSGCKGAQIGVYIGETKYNRQPFMVFAGIRTMSNTFHTDHTSSSCVSYTKLFRLVLSCPPLIT